MPKKQLSEAEILAQQQAAEQARVESEFNKGITTLRDTIAPGSIQFEKTYYRIGRKFARTLFTYGYPRQIQTGWLSVIINIDEVIDISMFIYPVDSNVVVKNLTKKVTQLEASMELDAEHGKVKNVNLENTLNDAEQLRSSIAAGEQHFFRFGLYFTIYADSEDELNFVQNKVENILGQQMILTKTANSQQENGLNTTVPQFTDQLEVRRNMNTGALSTSFPFTSADLTQKTGVLYGINQINGSLVIFDRWSLENANMVVFAKSGAGKSFTVKLEALRTMMLGTEILIIDPENEYEKLCNAVGGSYIHLSLTSSTRINPFDLPRVTDLDDENSDPLKSNIATLLGLLSLMLGVNESQNKAEEISVLDEALNATYLQAGITSDPKTHVATPPTMQVLYDILAHMGGVGGQLAMRLKRFTVGTFSGIFSQQSNVDINNSMVVFNIRDLEDELRPIAMYIVLSHIWNIVRTQQKQRMLIVDEAWQLMKFQDSAAFLFSIAKRARKYALGLTTISQDVEDFIGSDIGKAIVTNSSMQILLKQSTAAVDKLSDVFKLTDQEKKLLANFRVGTGLFFAGPNHVSIEIIASPSETQLVSTNPVAR